MRKVLAVHDAAPPHWVGDGFPVRSIFSYDGLGREALSPFLMLDYAAPRHFDPAPRRRGVGVHPHRGFETVTIVYAGRARAPRLGRQRRPHRPGRRAVDDGGLRDPARGIPLGALHPRGRHDVDDAALGEPAGARQDGEAALPDDPRRLHPARRARRRRRVAARHRGRVRGTQGPGRDLHADGGLGPARRRRQVGDAEDARGPHDGHRADAGPRDGQRRARGGRRRRSCGSRARAANSRSRPRASCPRWSSRASRSPSRWSVTGPS